jgi:hypothetical protein
MAIIPGSPGDSRAPIHFLGEGLPVPVAMGAAVIFRGKRGTPQCSGSFTVLDHPEAARVEHPATGGIIRSGRYRQCTVLSVHPEKQWRGLMENGRRFGEERRKRAAPFSGNRRSGRERREVLKDPDRTLGRLRMIPMFDGLTTEQLNGLLSICSKKTYVRNERVFLIGDESDEMFILIQGKLLMGSCAPLGIVGELGIITGEHRTATVTAGTECIVLSFRKEELLALFDADSRLRTNVLTNIIRDMMNKLRKEEEVIKRLRKIRSFETL